MAESSRFSTFTVFAGGSGAAEVACFPLEMTTTPPMARATARTAAPSQHPGLPLHWTRSPSSP